MEYQIWEYRICNFTINVAPFNLFGFYLFFNTIWGPLCLKYQFILAIYLLCVPRISFGKLLNSCRLFFCKLFFVLICFCLPDFDDGLLFFPVLNHLGVNNRLRQEFSSMVVVQAIW